jgi:hypothetical protein
MSKQRDSGVGLDVSRDQKRDVIKTTIRNELPKLDLYCQEVSFPMLRPRAGLLKSWELCFNHLGLIKINSTRIRFSKSISSSAK